VPGLSIPCSIRIQGRRFVSDRERSAAKLITIAVHARFHRPYAFGRSTLESLLAPLRSDPWMISLIKDLDPAYGCSTFAILIEEGCAQALDPIVAVRLGVANMPRSPAKRWWQG
jgi:hypothetical protein